MYTHIFIIFLIKFQIPASKFQIPVSKFQIAVSEFVNHKTLTLLQISMVVFYKVHQLYPSITSILLVTFVFTLFTATIIYFIYDSYSLLRDSTYNIFY